MTKLGKNSSKGLKLGAEAHSSEYLQKNGRSGIKSAPNALSYNHIKLYIK